MKEKIKKFKEKSVPGATGSLFPDTQSGRGRLPGNPLADRMRPSTLEQFLGQEDLMSEGAILRRMIDQDRLSSVIFWGPPGSGKTTLARLIADRTGANFLSYSAVTSGSREMKEVMAGARDLRGATGRRTILFVDEVHRFNRAQQDAFLPYVESGDVILIGATTENPSFEVNAALLSRSRVFVFKPLTDEQVLLLVDRALAEDPELSNMTVEVAPEARTALCRHADGDARRALNALEMSVLVTSPGEDGRRHIGAEEVRKALQRKSLAYDRAGEEHYNIISALHKSLRGSDPDASLYWLARMLEAGEDRRYVLRRLARVAVEDVGMADPGALGRAVEAHQAFDFMGEPEGDLVLAQLVVYLALAPKSNSIYVAYGKARRDAVDDSRPVPYHIRNAPTRLMREVGYAEGYEYSHDMPEGVSSHGFFPDGMGEPRYYRPGEAGLEKRAGERLKEIRERIRKQRKKAKEPGGEET